MNLYDLFPRRVRDSLQERGRHLSKTAQARKLAAELGVSGPEQTPDLHLLQTLLSIRAMMPSRPRVLVDVGAHSGDFSAAAAPAFGFTKLICFEPDIDLVPSLAARVRPLGGEVHAVALSDKEGECAFHVHADRSMSSLLPADPAILRQSFCTYDVEDVRTREVPVTTLDTFLSGDCGPESSGDHYFIKIDTQGNEMQVLRGARRTLTRTDACLVEFMFCTPYERRDSFRDLIDFMDDTGFECCGALDIRRRANHRVSGVDFLFVSTAGND